MARSHCEYDILRQNAKIDVYLDTLSRQSCESTSMRWNETDAGKEIWNYGRPICESKIDLPARLFPSAYFPPRARDNSKAVLSKTAFIFLDFLAIMA